MSDNKPDLKNKIIIEGITESGNQFRPSDWAERISGTLSTFHNRRVYYSPLLQPLYRSGYKCVALDPSLKETNPDLYQSILNFAKSNNLKICSEEDEGEK